MAEAQSLLRTRAPAGTDNTQPCFLSPGLDLSWDFILDTRDTPHRVTPFPSMEFQHKVHKH